MIMGFTPKYGTETIAVPADVVPHEEGSEPLQLVIRVTLTRAAAVQAGGCQPS